jgi:hypothetical protein
MRLPVDGDRIRDLAHPLGENLPIVKIVVGLLMIGSLHLAVWIERTRIEQSIPGDIRRCRITCYAWVF